MTQQPNALKVGVVSFLMAVCIGVLLIWKSSIFLKATGYPLVGEFRSIGGLLNNAQVRYRGYKVGKVFEIEPRADMIRVYFWVNPDVKVPMGSRLKVVFDGLIGEKFLVIVPNEESDEIAPEETVFPGYASSGLADFVEVGVKNLEHSADILKTYREILTSTEVATSIQDSILAFGEISAEMKMLLRQLSQIAQAVDLKESVENLNEMSALFKEMTVSLNDDVVSSTNVAQVQTILQNLGDFTEKLDRLLPSQDELPNSAPATAIKTLMEMEVHPEASLIYSFLPQTYNYDAGVKFDYQSNFLSIGLGDRTGVTQIEKLQYGTYLSENMSMRVGLFYTKPGGALDYRLTRALSVGLEVYDLNRFDYDVFGRWRLGDNFDSRLTFRKDTLESNSLQNVSLGVSFHR